MSLSLRNGIPLLYYRSKFSSANLWFTQSGDCIDTHFGPSGLSHMLEHIYVPNCNQFYTNGVTLTSSISFIAIDFKKNDKNNKNDKNDENDENDESKNDESKNDNKSSNKLQYESVYHYLLDWFFEGGKVKDLIKNHNIADRICELNNETHIKELQYGQMLSINESLRENKYTVYSQFDDSYHPEEIRKCLYNLFNYLMDPNRIIICFTGPEDTRKNYIKLYNKTFGTLESSKISIPSNHIINNSILSNLNITLKDLRTDTVLLVNCINRKYIESSYIIPIPDDSILLNDDSILDNCFSNKYGSVFTTNSIFEVGKLKSSIKNKFYIEIRVIHPTTSAQMKYYHTFQLSLNRLEKQISNLSPKMVSNDLHNDLRIEHLITLSNNFSTGVVVRDNIIMPKTFYAVFVINTPQVSDNLEVSMITMKKQKKENKNESDNISISTQGLKIQSYETINNKSLLHSSDMMRYNYQCVSDIKQDVFYNLILNSSLGNSYLMSNQSIVYFPMTYENVLSAMVLQTFYSQYMQVYQNKIHVYHPEMLSLLYNPPMIRFSDINRSSIPNFIMNLRTYSLMEPQISYNTAIDLIMRNTFVSLSITPTVVFYNNIARNNYCNDLFVCNHPFNYFVHILDHSPGSYSEIIRSIYKQSGLIYWGDMSMYGSNTVIKGIMM